MNNKTKKRNLVLLKVKENKSSEGGSFLTGVFAFFSLFLAIVSFVFAVSF